MTFLAISSQVVIDFGINELKHNLAAPFKKNGNNYFLIASSNTWYCFYESQITTKFSTCMSSLDSPFNSSSDCSSWYITTFSSKLFAIIYGLTRMRLKSFNCGRAFYQRSIIMVCWLILGGGLTWLPIFWFTMACP